MSWGWAVFLAVAILFFALVAHFVHALDLGIFEKIEHALMAVGMVVALAASVWFIAVIIHVRNN